MRNLNKIDIYNPSWRQMLAIGAIAVSGMVAGDAAGVIDINLPGWSAPHIEHQSTVAPNNVENPTQPNR